MKLLLVASLFVLSATSFAKTIHTPKLSYNYEVCQAIHAGKCWEETDKAFINCESDLDQVCRAINSKYTSAVKESVQCKKLHLGLGQKFMSNTGYILGTAWEIGYDLTTCGKVAL